MILSWVGSDEWNHKAGGKRCKVKWAFCLKTNNKIQSCDEKKIYFCNKIVRYVIWHIFLIDLVKWLINMRNHLFKISWMISSLWSMICDFFSPLILLELTEKIINYKLFLIINIFLSDWIHNLWLLMLIISWRETLLVLNYNNNLFICVVWVSIICQTILIKFWWGASFSSWRTILWRFG